MDCHERADPEGRKLTQHTESTKYLFNDCPCGILRLDADGRILEANPALEAMLGLSSSQLAGHDRNSLPYPAFRGLFKGEEGMLHLIGPGVETERWLQCRPGSGPGPLIHYFTDVTELVRLREQTRQLRTQVEELTVSDSLTGLANQRAFNRALTAQVTRSRRYQNPLSLILVELLDRGRSDGQPSDEGVLATSRYLRDRLRWVDVIARWDHNHFLVILPETDEASAAELIRKIDAEFASGETASERPGLLLRFGSSSWRKGDDERKLMDRAAAALNSEGHGPQAVASS